MKKIINYLKKEKVLTIAICIALITCFFVPVDKNYLKYYDYNTLACLFCILTVVVGLKNTNIFVLLSRKLVSLFHTRRAVILTIVLTTFFMDMIVANDMSLITLLPLTYIVLHSTNNDNYLAFTYVLQTIAANMGGMITPYGNPQNLYLYSYYNIPTLEFIKILLVQSLAVLILLILCIIFVKNEKMEIKDKTLLDIPKMKLIIYIILFFLVILGIFRIIPYQLILILVIIVNIIIDKSVFKKIDYALIATFIAFFTFSGNMARIPAINQMIYNIVNTNTLLSGLISCQFISNVPTAIFLSKFTTDYKNLLIAVNIGSLGTMISSLASLIALKEYLKYNPKGFIKYLYTFTIYNTLFLFVLLIITLII